MPTEQTIPPEVLRKDPQPKNSDAKYALMPIQDRIPAYKADMEAWYNRNPAYRPQPSPAQVQQQTAPSQKPALLVPVAKDQQATGLTTSGKVTYTGQASSTHVQENQRQSRVAAYFLEWEPVTPTRSIDLWTRSNAEVKSATDLSGANLEAHSDQENATHYATTAWYLPFTPQKGVIISSVDFDTSNVVSYSQTFGGKRVTAFGDGFPKVNITFKMARAFYHKRYIRALRMSGLLTSNSLRFPGRLILHNILQERSVYDTMHPEERRRSLDEVIRRAANGETQRSAVSRLEGFHLMVDRVQVAQGEGELHVVTVTMQATVLEFLTLGG